MKTKPFQIDISKAMSICIRAGIKVYPVPSGRRFKVEVDDNGELIRYNKELSDKDLNVALSKTYKHYAVLLINKKKHANITKENKKTLET